MEFQKPVIDLIAERISTRSYDEREIDKDSLERLLAAIEEVNAGMTIRARFLLLDKYEESNDSERFNGSSGYTEESAEPVDGSKGYVDGSLEPAVPADSSRAADAGSDGEQLGTYGMIAGARSFLVGIIDKEEKDAAEFGFQFERIILFATGLGIQTCWLGGTFDRAALSRKIVLKENEFIPVISPAGYKRAKPRIRDAVIRATIGADKRKAWDQLFFYESTDTALEKYQAADFSTCLEMARLAPSASNKQPWRVIKNDNGFHFFLSRTKGYGPENFDIQKNDVGIAMCHFELAAREKGLTGNWVVRTDTVCPGEWEYIKTWQH